MPNMHLSQTPRNTNTDNVTCTSKVCVGCNEEQPAKNFYVSKSSKDGLNRYCTWCCKVNRGLENVRARDARNNVSNRQIHRAKGLGIHFDPEVKLVEVFRRARGICGLCNVWVPPKTASMDHINPLSKGGIHTYDNIQLTHLKCNLKKGNRNAVS